MMLRISFTSLLLVCSSIMVSAEPPSLVRAAEASEQFLLTESLEGRRLGHLFTLVALTKVTAQGADNPHLPVWKGELWEKTRNPAVPVIVNTDSGPCRRYLAVHDDGTVRLSLEAVKETAPSVPVKKRRVIVPAKSKP